MNSDHIVGQMEWGGGCNLLQTGPCCLGFPLGILAVNEEDYLANSDHLFEPA